MSDDYLADLNYQIEKLSRGSRPHSRRDHTGYEEAMRELQIKRDLYLSWMGGAA